MCDILLNCLPPYRISFPNPSLSILKKFLGEQNIKVNIKYWNIELNSIYRKYLNFDKASDEVLISPITAINLINDKKTFQKNETFLYGFRKDIHLSISQFNNVYNNLIKELKDYILKEFKNQPLQSAKLFGISFKYNQWIPGLVISKILKEIEPDINIVIGGIDDKQTALLILENFDCFDYAIWGEGEYPLLNLYKTIDSKTFDFKNVPQLVYKHQNEYIANSISKKHFFNNYSFPDYDDYFDSLKINKFKPQKIELPINAVRGCSWNKCKFCVSRKGAKFQERTPSSVVEEIKYHFSKYGISNFVFVDNSSYKDLNKLYLLCDKLIELNNSTDKYIKIGMSINNYGINRELADKLCLAGIRRIQVGFESFSDNYLSLMNKENKLADNILFIKNILRYNIMLPLLILSDLPKESIDDIIESIDNLHYFRFYFNDKNFNINFSPLGIHNGSKYYKELSKEQLKLYNINEMVYLLDDVFKDIDKNKLLFMYRKIQTNSIEWNKFYSILKEYKENNYSYKFIKNNDNIHFIEYLNDKEIETIIFDDPLYIKILKLTEDEICTFDSLFNKINSENSEITKDSVLEILNNLKSIYLLYYTDDLSQIVSTIFVN